MQNKSLKSIMLVELKRDMALTYYRRISLRYSSGAEDYQSVNRSFLHDNRTDILGSCLIKR